MLNNIIYIWVLPILSLCCLKCCLLTQPGSNNPKGYPGVVLLKHCSENSKSHPFPGPDFTSMISDRCKDVIFHH